MKNVCACTLLTLSLLWHLSLRNIRKRFILPRNCALDADSRNSMRHDSVMSSSASARVFFRLATVWQLAAALHAISRRRDSTLKRNNFLGSMWVWACARESWLFSKSMGCQDFSEWCKMYGFGGEYALLYIWISAKLRCNNSSVTLADAVSKYYAHFSLLNFSKYLV